MYRFFNFGLFFFLICSVGFAQPVISYQSTNIMWGGRTVSVTVHPVFSDEVIAASATGGLFKTTDGGVSWKHLDGLPVFMMMDVAYNPIFTNKVIATCLVDTDTSHTMGIWMSNDRGETWSQAPAPVVFYLAGSIPRYNKRFSAYGISFDMNGVAYVGTDYGIAIGKSGHTRWEHVMFDRTIPLADNKLQNAAYSLIAFGSGKLLIGASSGVYYCNDMYLAKPFVKSMTEIVFSEQVIHGMAQSPYSEKDIVIAPKVKELWVSTDTGKLFYSTPIPEFDRESRPPVVAMVKTPGRPGYIDIYTQRVKLFRKTCYKDELNVMAKNWVQMNVEHDDINGFGIVKDEVRYVADDGGLFKKIGEDHWRCTGIGRNGYNALQVYQVWGQKTEPPAPSTAGIIPIQPRVNPVITNSNSNANPKIDYYFGTQDNDIWSSSDKGVSWPHNGGTEGGGFDGPRIFAGSPLGVWPFIYIDNSLGINKGAWPNYAPFGPWRDPGVPSGNPKYAGNGTFLQLFFDTLTGNKKIMQTQTYGSRWDTVAGIRGYNLFQGEKAGMNDNYFMYFPYARPLTPLYDLGNIGLLRLQCTISRGGAVAYTLESMDTVSTLGSLMIYGTDFAWPTVYGFDPNNGNTLLVPDARDKVMKWSRDGGRNWKTDFALTRLVTENDRYIFSESPVNFLVWTVSFNPSDSRQIAIGTKDAGIVYTRNGGLNWCRIPGSKQIPHITSIWWDFDGTALISSYGRGLWRFNPAAYQAGSGECISTLVPIGAITLQKNRADIPFRNLPVQTTVQPIISAQLQPVSIANLNRPSVPVAGIISSTMYNGEMVMGSNGFVRITGFGFSPSISATLELDGKIILKNIPVDKEGKINFPVTLNLPQGINRLIIVQQNLKNKTETTLVIKKPFRDDKNK